MATIEKANPEGAGLLLICCAKRYLVLQLDQRINRSGDTETIRLL